jgi:hypothetical protein
VTVSRRSFTASVPGMAVYDCHRTGWKVKGKVCQLFPAQDDEVVVLIFEQLRLERHCIVCSADNGFPPKRSGSGLPGPRKPQ